MDKAQLKDLLKSVLPELMDEVYGVDLSQLPSTLGHIDSLTKAQAEQRWKSVINLDGSEYDRATKAIQDYYSKLPEAQQAALDNEEGLKLIWNTVQGQLDLEDTEANNVSTQTPIMGDDGESKSSVNRLNFSPRRVFTQEEIESLMDSGQYDDPQIQQAIAQAYEEGRVN